MNHTGTQPEDLNAEREFLAQLQEYWKIWWRYRWIILLGTVAFVVISSFSIRLPAQPATTPIPTISIRGFLEIPQQLAGNISEPHYIPIANTADIEETLNSPEFRAHLEKASPQMSDNLDKFITFNGFSVSGRPVLGIIIQGKKSDVQPKEIFKTVLENLDAYYNPIIQASKDTAKSWLAYHNKILNYLINEKRPDSLTIWRVEETVGRLENHIKTNQRFNHFTPRPILTQTKEVPPNPRNSKFTAKSAVIILTTIGGLSTMLFCILTIELLRPLVRKRFLVQ